MKTLQVGNGDLQKDSGGRLQFVQGNSKLLQDLTLWLKENYGIGFTTPNFGSTLPAMVGSAITRSSMNEIQAEVQRVITLYQTQQFLALRQAQTTSQLANWNKSEIINSINSINVSSDPYTSYGNVQVAVSLTTLAGSSVDLTVFIDSNGIQAK